MVTALVGAQYGSEGKGLIAAHIANKFTVHIRTGAPNAGHTFYHPVTGDKWVMQQIPCGWINEDASLVIGPGAVIDIDQLRKEARLIEAAGYRVKSRLYIDANATVLEWRHDEGGVGGKAHELIGSTGKGVGLARMARINRRSLVHPSVIWSHCTTVADIMGHLQDDGFVVSRDTSKLVDSWLDEGAQVLLEGTQGSGLSLIHGPWPYVTSADTNAAQLCADAGISPRALTDIILVARTFPIRVAGHSGPLLNEITWETLGVEPEYTTVTKKVRRVGMWDEELFAKAVRLNRPCRVALTFMDYIDLFCADLDDADKLTQSHPRAIQFIRDIERTHNVRVSYVGTGPRTVVDRD